MTTDSTAAKPPVVKPLNVVDDCGVDPTGRSDSYNQWQHAFVVASVERRPLYYPGERSASIVSDTIGSTAEAPITLLAEGGAIALMPNRAMPPKGFGSQQGRHLLAIRDVPSVTFRDVVLDYQGAQQPHCVGDNWRMTDVANVDFKAVVSRNPRGLTTQSSPTMPETFAGQLLHVDTALLRQCAALPQDGAPTATGFVAHWCRRATFDACLAYGFRGQGFGGYSQAPLDEVFTLTRSWAHRCHHGYNFEGGPEGIADVELGVAGVPDQRCISTQCDVGIVVNGNPAAVGRVAAYAYESREDLVPLAVVGAPGHVTMLDVNIVDPVSVGVLSLMCGTGNRAALALTTVSGTLHNAHHAPIITPSGFTVPPSWKLSVTP